MRQRISLLLALVLALTLCACGQKIEETTMEDASPWQEQYDLGMHYLSEGDYEQAILAFEAAIRIDPKQADAYLGLAEVYVQQGETEKAAEVLDKAIAELGETTELTQAKAALQKKAVYDDGSYMVWTYDAKGTEIGAYYSADGTLISVTEFISEYSRRLTEYGPDGAVTVVFLQELNPDGYVEWVTECYPDGSPICVRQFDAAGHWLKETVYEENGVYTDMIAQWNGDQLVTISYYQEDFLNRVDELNPDGTIKQTLYYETDGSYGSMEYNSAGTMVRSTGYDADGNKMVTEYDSSGNFSRIAYNNADGSYSIGEYDASGYVMRDTHYNADGTINWYMTYEYDGNGNLTRQTQYKADGSINWVHEE